MRKKVADMELMLILIEILTIKIFLTVKHF